MFLLLLNNSYVKNNKFLTFIIISQAIGTTEFTGLVMIPMIALGHVLAQASINSATIEALMSNKSSRVIPGLRGLPAGMTTTSTPASSSKIISYYFKSTKVTNFLKLHLLKPCTKTSCRCNHILWQVFQCDSSQLPHQSFQGYHTNSGD